MDNKTWPEAFEGAHPRTDARAAQLTNQFAALWRDIEPLIRTWIAEGDTLSEQDWLDLSESTRAFYGDLKVMMARYHKDRQVH